MANNKPGKNMSKPAQPSSVQDAIRRAKKAKQKHGRSSRHQGPTLLEGIANDRHQLLRSMLSEDIASSSNMAQKTLDKMIDTFIDAYIDAFNRPRRDVGMSNIGYALYEVRDKYQYSRLRSYFIKQTMQTYDKFCRVTRGGVSSTSPADDRPRADLSAMTAVHSAAQRASA